MADAEEKLRLEERVEELEAQVRQLTDVIDALDIPGVTTDSVAMEDLQFGRLPVGAALSGKPSKWEVEGMIEDAVGADGSVSTSVSEDELLPIHSMWFDLQRDYTDSIPSDNARRGARLFAQIVRRATGDSEPKVNVTDRYYTMDSGQASDVLKAADDITDGGVSKTVARSMRAIQRFTKREDCGCQSIGACDHGLILFDDSGGTNRLVAEKDAVHDYCERVKPADDDGEQPSEAPTPADVSQTETEAADEELDALSQATPVSGNSDTVVSNLESKASERPIIPDDFQD